MLALAIAGCSTGTVQSVASTVTTPTSTTAPPTSTTITTTTTTTTAVPATVPPDLAAFGTEVVTVDGREWLVAVADTPDERFQGLRRVADLGALDGMIFVYDSERESSFTMRTVPIPLDIGFFDTAGVLFDIVSMLPCGDSEDCPSYYATGPFQFTIERAAGGWEGVPIGAQLVR